LQDDHSFAILRWFSDAVELHGTQFHHCADVTADVTQRGKEQLSFPAGGVKLYHAKRDTLSGFQLVGIQKNGCPTKAFEHDSCILLGAVPTVRNIS
jgi:hypothetical protein